MFVFSKILGAVFAFGGAMLCALGGIMLLFVQSQNGSGVMEAIAHGLGVYCFGKAAAVLSAATFSGGLPAVQSVTVVPPIQGSATQKQ